MLNISLIVVFLLLGIFFQRFKIVPPNTSKYLNNYLIYVVLPALALRYLPKIDLNPELLLPVASAWIGFGLSWLIFGTLGKIYNWGNSVTGCLVITAGLANTSFVGIPIIQALYGEEAVQIALLIDQAGSFIIVSSVAVIVASIYSVEKKRKRDISRKILTFPPFIFFLIAIGLNVFEVEIGANIDFILQLITITLTPVALTSVGLQVKMDFDAFRSKFLWYGLGYKLVLIPFVILILFKYVFQMQGLIFQVSVMEAAMAPMITGSIIAITHDLEPKLASLLVGIGIPLSFLTLGIWYFIVA
ncbi:AEC family transporter [Aquiflexum gelatinilyticum]|uniref:AEC family transporter n=1 Tax=Aquiflexum gelatinilyticum TaxID=2961943 RepID=A0A9X2SZJ6_9BACT|nr:AEC family transporter [Aquiflexum gelatinilyticum]MCR9014568.1 AEC family transporter [Aquiflexum gelatinilyticum]